MVRPASFLLTALVWTATCLPVFVSPIQLPAQSFSPAQSVSPEESAELRRPKRESKSPCKRIVLLYSHRIAAPVNSEWYQGIATELKAAFPGPVDIDVEYLDLQGNHEEEIEQKWIDLLRTKYSRKRPDLVIPIYISAITFLMAHRDEVFPGVPIVFCSAPENLAVQARKLPGVTGTTFEPDFGGTRELIRRLLPDVKNLVVITGKARESLDWQAALGVGLLFSMYFGQAFEVEIWDARPLVEMEEAISRLPEDTAVLMLPYEYDKQGNQYVSSEVTQLLSRRSSVPIFGIFDSLVGLGALGGSVVSVADQGRLTGRLAAEILQGRKPEELVVPSPAKPQILLDAGLLKRFRIPAERIPKSAILENLPPGIWPTFGRYLLLGGGALIFQSAIIISLLLNRNRRIAAEREARELAGKILTAQEEERSYLARELHDDLSQRLAAVAIEAGNLENQSTVQSLAGPELGKLKQGIISICDDLHRLSRQMHPSILDDFGLADALCADCSSLMQRTDIEVDCQIGELPSRLPKPLELCLYRVAQESLWNAVKHAGASRVTVQLHGDSKQIHLAIEDDGRGLASSARPSTKGLGLASIQERIRLVSGVVEFQSEPGQGTRIVATVPLRSLES